MLSGDLAGAWWYDALFAPGADRARLVAELRAAPEHVPAAMALLADRGEAARFAASLDAGEARSLAGALIERFGLAGILGAARAWQSEEETPAAQEGIREREPASLAATWAPAAPETEALWRAGQGAQELFVGLSLTLVRAPESARRAPFAERAGELWARVEAGQSARAPRGAEPDERPSPAEAPALRSAPAITTEPATATPALATAPSTAAREPAAPPPHTSEIACTSAASAAPKRELLNERETAFFSQKSAAHELAPSPAQGTDFLAAEAAPGEPSPTASGLGAPKSTRRADIDLPAPAAPQPSTESAPAEPREPVPPRPQLFGRSVYTRFGGLFFLINLGIALELYSDFTSPLSPGIDLLIWDFLALVGRELLGEAASGDPVFALLADLAGRSPEEPPGAGFAPPAELVLPAAWLQAFPEGPPYPWDTAADAADSGAADTGPGATPLSRWLRRLMPCIRARLSRALLAPDGVDPGRLLCALGATVHVTETHLDVVFSLAELPIEVRLSGLDRDPGWVPAAGRYVAFHFVLRDADPA